MEIIDFKIKGLKFSIQVTHQVVIFGDLTENVIVLSGVFQCTQGFVGSLQTYLFWNITNGMQVLFCNVTIANTGIQFPSLKDNCFSGYEPTI